MLKKLKTKLILITIIALFVVLATIVGSINVLHHRTIVLDADETLSLILSNSGKYPSIPDEDLPDTDINITPEAPYEARYFAVVFLNGKLAWVNTDNIAAVDDGMAINIAKEVVGNKIRSGFYNNYRYLVDEKDGRTMVLFLDCSRLLISAERFLIFSIVISLIGVLVVFFVLSAVAEKIVTPIADGYEKQKIFITNAGHDIKTPITIINADAELLEMELEDNEWVADIKKQASRLATLTSDLIYLTRMEEEKSVPHEDFPLSDILEEVVGSFAGPAKTKNISIKCDIAPAIFYTGEQESIRKLFFLLMDNAIKYSPADETVEIVAKQTIRGGISVRFSNLAPQLDSSTTKRMFDRFYRSDKARTSGGGFGIGLSVASAIVHAHKGKISAEKHGDVLTIDIIL
jgi:signal transduction histidine kinase